MIATRIANMSRFLRLQFPVTSFRYRIPMAATIRFSNSNHVNALCCLQTRPFSSTNNPKFKITLTDIRNAIDLKENRDKSWKVRLIGIKDQVIKLGGIRVLVFHCGTFVISFIGLYIFFKYGVLDIDTMLSKMNEYAFTRPYIGMVASHPEASYLLLSFFATDLIDPLRYVLALGYTGYIIRKRYIDITMENINTQNESIKEAAKSVVAPNIEKEEEKNPELKKSRIITIKGKNNSTLNM